MKIAVTGARGSVGREVVKLCAKEGHSTVQINRSEQEHDGTPNSEMRIADAATDYDATVKALGDCDALIHLAAVPNPLGKSDWEVHQNNVCSAFNGLRAAAEVGIKRICYASSVNAIGLAYSQQKLHLPYFPIDEDYPCRPSDSYALAKLEAETAAKAFPHWFPGLRIACLRIHEVENKSEVLKEHKENWDEAGVKQLWGWVNPVATARACLLGVTNGDRWKIVRFLILLRRIRLWMIRRARSWRRSITLRRSSEATGALTGRFGPRKRRRRSWVGHIMRRSRCWAVVEMLSALGRW